ncbi:helix-turn-helix transcriptional regulator [Salmonella enterica subsp. enterica]|uniref:helix-turn-helix domain-containing protein n=1 Tax=Salmonella enterica TaxID=28901 RepID=UPI00071AD2E6|nr:helix-turn-helix transcriptional regulator [Salmonella enterica]EBG5321696.1 helix-turn-helix transcriptional regulator [Salmonella enterica subsp. enterica serovar Fresno]EBZ5775179.1 XRE family transcriptional regulator [Salmonella enterica subsp. enterica serovar Redlands]ECH9281666.1 XRE family transcriptional regulator [Salmonella enterica subsp. enterica]EEH2709095.1 helix-turn-helix transcriptional regulator [Salmonella enterica subsp. enterica serovar Lille]EEO9884278.1 helix-turn-h
MASVYSEEYQSVIKVLRDTRVKKGITQEKLAQAMNRPQSFIAKIESGERRLDVIEFAYVAQLLDINPAPLLEKVMKKMRPM